ncbi:Sulfite reductase [ferredoxin] [bacterium HR40]|nr:Sulfite reductase [ferredoxin] [bacterium HR40]
MYRYDSYDEAFVRARVAQFRDQVRRRLAGELTEEEFRPHRLMNGLYLQLHAYMLRVAIPYGTLSSRQLRRLAEVADRWDRGYGHFTTRQNIQFNWPRLEDVPDILEALAEVGLHGIQTSGNCIRNITTDAYAGVAADEVADPRPFCELLRQWSSLHPEFSFLPRKFKIAVSASPHDRAAIRAHDIGLRLYRDDAGELAFEVLAGGGLGRTPMIAKTVREHLPARQLLPYVEAILRVYNRFGRRDHKFKSRIKILVHEIGLDAFRAAVEEEYARSLDPEDVELAALELERIEELFAPPPYEELPARDPLHERRLAEEPAFARFARTNLRPHRVPGYAIVDVSLKPVGGIPGDVTSDQMRRLADLADRFSFGELRTTHTQNLALPHVRLRDVHSLWELLEEAGLGTPNIGLVTDIVCCPGLDYCALATARSIPIARALARRFAELDAQERIGPLSIRMSGCINACGQHHIGHIGILGLEKRGEESYQITLGGRPDERTAIGRILGPGFSASEVVDAVEAVLRFYLEGRNGPQETFADFVERVGVETFREVVYAPVRAR